MMNSLHKPKIAILDSNILAVIGLRTILHDVMPIMDIDVYTSFDQLEANHSELYFHFFVSMNIVFENRHFFLANRTKTIVLSATTDEGAFSEFNVLHVNVSEEQLIKSVLMLEQHAHGHGQHLPTMMQSANSTMLSAREIEVLSLVAQGCINKEIADRLGIGITTVISHRKNIQDKLGLKSVSALTIYAVTHGYVDINKI